MERYFIRYSFLLISLIAFYDTYAQYPQHNWAINMGSSHVATLYGELGTSIAKDSLSNNYITGLFNGNADFDPSLLPSILSGNGPGASNAFIAKYDSSGRYKWAFRLGGNSMLDDIVPRKIIYDNQGNIYITGKYMGTVDFDPGTGVSNLVSTTFGSYYDGFLAKYDTLGNYQWAISLSGNSDMDEGVSIVTDQQGNPYFTGRFKNTVDFDPGIGVANLTSNGIDDIFVAKYDVNGNYLWAINIGGNNFDFSHAITIDNQDNVIITGDFNGTVDFDPSPSISNLISSGVPTPFIAKYDNTGNYLWAFEMKGVMAGGTGNELDVDEMGNIYVTGFFNGTVDFDPSNVTNNLSSNGALIDAFVAKYDSNGNYLWAFSIGDNNMDRGNDIKVDRNNNIYVTGSIIGGADFDPGPNSAYIPGAGGNDIFIASYDENGNYLWAEVFGTISDESGIAIDLSYSNCQIFMSLTGGFTTTIDFDPSMAINNITSYGDYDVFISNYKVGEGGILANVYAGDDQSICSGDSVKLNASGGTNYLWSPSTSLTNDIIATPTAFPQNTIDYIVTVNDGKGCAGTDTVTVFVLPPPVVNAGNDIEIYRGDSVQLFASGGDTYLWSPDTSLSCTTCSDPWAKPIKTTTYCVKVTDTLTGCSSSDCMMVKIISKPLPTDVFVPDIFSPNNDGINDILYVNGKNIMDIEFVVYNRWGEKVFESQDLNVGWDGNYKGEELNTAVFMWYLKVTYLNNTTNELKGNVTLLR